MKRLIAFAAAGGLLLLGAFAFLSATAPTTAEAQEDTSPGPTVMGQASILDRLVEAGIISQDEADAIAEQLPEARRELRKLIDDIDPATLEGWFTPHEFSFDEDRVRPFFDNFDWDALRKHLENLDLDGLTLEDIQLPEGFELPEGFDLEEMQRRFDAFDFNRFTERMPATPFGGLFEDVTPEELRDAIENGTLDELIDLDELIAQAEERHDDMLEKLAESGRFTDEQLAEIQERFDDMLGRLESGDFGFGGFGSFHGRHRHGPFGAAGGATIDEASLGA